MDVPWFHCEQRFGTNLPISGTFPFVFCQKFVFKGERLSHAVGCAFAVCLEQKQKRDREAQIIAQIQPAAIPTAAQQPASQVQSNASTIAETTSLHGSFRRASLQERKQDPQNIIHTGWLTGGQQRLMKV